MSNYIANYKGGRNESFMYGVDKDTLWYDYDLISAYPTAMSLMGKPDYSTARRITREELDSMGYENILYSYVVVKGTFTYIPKPKASKDLEETVEVKINIDNL